MLNEIITYLQYPFVIKAIIVVLLVAISASLIGVSLVLRHLSFIGDGLAHVAFGAYCVATVMSFTSSSNIYIVLPVTILAAMILVSIKPKTAAKSDSALAILSVSMLSIGYLALHIFAPNANIGGDVCATLFGSTLVLTMSMQDVIFSSVLALLLILFFIINYQKIFLITFDENFAIADGINIKLFNLILSCVIGIVIVIAMKLVGALLISALIVFPAVTALNIGRSFFQVSIISVISALLGSILGFVCSIGLNLPIGATIVISNLLLYIISLVVKLRD
ncbi:MAG: metal ABC transporter permease [Succinivibrionaceae bacterium]